MKSLPLLIVALYFALPVFGQREQTVEVMKGEWAIGRATVVAKWTTAEGNTIGLAVTAHHVVELFPGQAFEARFFDGNISKNCYVTAIDKACDLAIFVLWIPQHVSPTSIRTKEDFDRAESFTREWDIRPADVAIRDRGSAFYLAEPQQGESGGGVFWRNEETGECELVGVVSGGWFWLDSPRSDTTWPMRCSRGSRIQALLDGVDKQKLTWAR